MITLLKTNHANHNFINLVNALDKALAISDGDEHEFYHQFNGIESLNHCLVMYDDEIPIGCGALKKYDANRIEIKRMYIDPLKRRNGYGSTLLRELEKWAFELGYAYCILETGKRQPDAIALYYKNKYTIIENYGQYKGVDNSLCFRKELGL